MTHRHNEQTSMIRQEPFAYVCEYDANGNPEYQAWAYPGASTSSSVWIASKNTYDADGNLTRTQWATDSDGKVGLFTVAATSLSTLTYA